MQLESVHVPDWNEKQKPWLNLVVFVQDPVTDFVEQVALFTFLFVAFATTLLSFCWECSQERRAELEDGSKSFGLAW